MTGTETVGDGDRTATDAALDAWLVAVGREIGLEPADLLQVRDGVLERVRDVAHTVARPAGPLTAFAVGLAAGLALGREGADREDSDTGPRAEVGPGADTVTGVVDDLLAQVDALVSARAREASA